MSRIVVLGDVMVDVVVRLSGPLAQASDAPAEIRFRGGGSAANTAAWLAAAGAEVTLVGRVGDDERGRAAVEELRATGVDVRVALDPDRPTGTCLVLIEPGGERTMAPDAGANDGLAEEDLPGELLTQAGHLHVAGYALLREGSRAAARAAIERASGAGLGVSVDPSSSALLDGEFLDLAAGAGLLLPNASEAHALTGDSDPEAAARSLAERFGEVVVTLGTGRSAVDERRGGAARGGGGRRSRRGHRRGGRRLRGRLPEGARVGSLDCRGAGGRLPAGGASGRPGGRAALGVASAAAAADAPARQMASRPAGSFATRRSVSSAARSEAVPSMSVSARSLGRITLASSAVVRPSGNSASASTTSAGARPAGQGGVEVRQCGVVRLEGLEAADLEAAAVLSKITDGAVYRTGPSLVEWRSWTWVGEPSAERARARSAS